MKIWRIYLHSPSYCTYPLTNFHTIILSVKPFGLKTDSLSAFLFFYQNVKRLRKQSKNVLFCLKVFYIIVVRRFYVHYLLVWVFKNYQFDEYNRFSLVAISQTVTDEFVKTYFSHLLSLLIFNLYETLNSFYTNWC